MLDGPAGDSFRYALNRELVKLYTVVLAGWVVIDLSQWAFGIIDAPEPYQSLIELPVLLLGLALFVGGLVGVLHRVVADGTSAE